MSFLDNPLLPFGAMVIGYAYPLLTDAGSTKDMVMSLLSPKKPIDVLLAAGAVGLPLLSLYGISYGLKSANLAGLNGTPLINIPLHAALGYTLQFPITAAVFITLAMVSGEGLV